MREKKFRAWDKGKKKWLPENVFAVCNGPALFIIIEDFENYQLGEFGYPASFDLVGYTGLKDKNEAEIYEGDIVFNSNRTLITSKADPRIYLVKWLDGEYGETEKGGAWLKTKPGFIFEKMQPQGANFMSLIFSQDQIEVIGNIYEHPELINPAPK